MISGRLTLASDYTIKRQGEEDSNPKLRRIAAAGRYARNAAKKTGKMLLLRPQRQRLQAAAPAGGNLRKNEIRRNDGKTAGKYPAKAVTSAGKRSIIHIRYAYSFMYFNSRTI